WTMNCFACHGGQVNGQVHAGLPNSNYALQTLTEETRKTKLLLKKPLSRMDFGSVFIPLGRSNGTTNAVNFGVALMRYRDADLNIHRNRLPPKMLHHDMDAPPWWHFKRKHHIYIDGFAQKGVRGLMQFMLVEQNGPEKFREWETDFESVYKFLESVEPPPYPFSINKSLAESGRTVFNESCAKCHGTYGDGSAFPNVMVDIDEIGTDRVRLDSLTEAQRAGYSDSWFGQYGKQETIANPSGYIAPPLDGIWASAPYFHNGSVPTLWHVLHPDERPKVWKRTYDGYDQKRIGLEVQSFDEQPEVDGAELREYFNTTWPGKSASGHDFPNELSAEERAAVLEYLKTL
ncbi:MAG: c-type cytochrome, partial [Planctomycetales bacterium]|nr:c-type cytochrome [Planctomycetales bacterium]